MEINNMSNESGIKAATFKIGKKQFYISYSVRTKTIHVCCINATARAWGMYNGKYFSSKAAALKNYRSEEAKLAIEKASVLFIFN